MQLRIMKSLLAAIIMAFNLPVCASPILYGFSGIVTYKNDPHGVFNENVGDGIEFTILVDLNIQGSHSWDGFVYTYSDEAQLDAFYTDWIGGTQADYDYLRNAQSAPNYEHNVGINYTGFPLTALYFGDRVRILTYESIQNWSVGQPSIFDSSGAVLNSSSSLGYEVSALRGELTLTSITAVSEPTTLALVSLGLAGIGFTRKKRRS